MQITQMMVFKHTKFPNAAKAFVQFMMEPDQYNPWMKASIGYVSQPLKAYEKNPIWTDDPKATVYRDSASLMLDHGHEGPLGQASAACMADYVVVDMVAEAASGSKTVQQAIDRAAERASATTRLDADGMMPRRRAGFPRDSGQGQVVRACRPGAASGHHQSDYVSAAGLSCGPFIEANHAIPIPEQP
jgi:hypothetical protein